MNRTLRTLLTAATLFGAAGTAAAGSPRTVQISVTEQGFEPTPISVKKGEPLKLVITRKTDKTCAKSVVFDEPKLKKALPLNEPVEITFTPSKTGELKYGCAMGKMVEGVLKVE
jgi:plastocyanin domain-containing protein